MIHVNEGLKLLNLLSSYGTQLITIRNWTHLYTPVSKLLLNNIHNPRGVKLPIQGSCVQNQWVAPRLTWPFIFQRSIKRVPGNPGNLAVKSKLPPHGGSVTLRHLKPIHKKGPESLKIFLTGLGLGFSHRFDSDFENCISLPCYARIAWKLSQHPISFLPCHYQNELGISFFSDLRKVDGNSTWKDLDNILFSIHFFGCTKCKFNENQFILLSSINSAFKTQWFDGSLFRCRKFCYMFICHLNIK